ncbi:MAG: hypothetical protein ABI183_09355 [Polyangiaceae bacterium]
MRRRSFVVVMLGICAAPLLAIACGASDDTNANVPPQSCTGKIGIAESACPDASRDSSSSSDATSLSDRSITDAPSDATKDAGFFLPPPPPPACTGAVSIDTAFGNSGFIINTTAGQDFGGIGVQTDGKYIVTTFDGTDPSPLARRNTNGSIDTTFGTNGFAPSGIGSGQVLIDPRGRIVLTGANATQSFLMGYTLSGAVDTTFGVNGIGVTPYLSPIGILSAMDMTAQRPNGKIVGASTVYVNAGPHPPTRTDIGLVQLDQNGVADSTFGNHGLALAGFPNDASDTAIAIQPDGKILVGGFELNPIDDAGNGHQDFVVVRFNEDGSLDNTFGSGGKILVPLGSRFVAYTPGGFALQSTGNVVIAVTSVDGNPDGEVFQLLRIKPNGDIDTAFGTSGFASATFLGGNDNAQSVAVYADDSLIAGGSIGTLDDAGFATTLGFARFSPNGTVDTTFGTNGVLLVNPPGITEGTNLSVQILQTNGQVLGSAVGYNPDPVESDLDDYGILFRLTCP